jgi:hypothetical protein
MLWEAWVLSKSLRQSPAEVYFIEDQLAAWCFNRAVTMFGMAVEQDIEEATSKAKNDKQAKRMANDVLDIWLEKEHSARQAPSKFRDPAMR